MSFPPFTFLKQSKVVVTLVAALAFCYRVDAQPPITALELDEARHELLVGSQLGVIVYHWPDRQELRRISTELEHIHDLQLSPDQTALLIAGGSPAESGALELHSWPGGQRTASCSRYDDVIHRATWSPSGQRIALVSAAADGDLVDAHGQSVHRYSGHTRMLTSACFLSASEVVTGGIEGSLHMWSADTGQAIRVLDAHTAAIHDLALRKGSPVQLATVGGDQTVRLWQPQIARQIRFARLDCVPHCVAWSADDQAIVVGCDDGTVRWLAAGDMQVARVQATTIKPIFELLVTDDSVVVAGVGGFQIIE